MKAIGELEELLLIQAFDGRPLRTEYDPRTDGGIVIVRHEDGRHSVQLSVNDKDMELLKEDFETFKRDVANPAIHNLDSAAYPERWERLLPTFKRVAELLNGRSTR